MAKLQFFDFEGCRLAYRLAGEGPPLLMIQGVGAYGVSGWNPQTAILQNHYTCLTMDNRGLGASQPPGVDRLSVEQMTADSLAVIDHVGWESAHVVGHSLGGLISMQLALIARSRVRSLALLCTFARGADAMRLEPRLLWILLRLRFGPRALRRQAFLELVLSPGQMKTNSDRFAERLSRVLGHDIADLPAFSGQQLNAMKHHDLSARLGELSGIPTLVISGEMDRIARPEFGRAIATGIGGARYMEFSGAGHALPVLETERCSVALLQHLADAERQIAQTA